MADLPDHMHLEATNRQYFVLGAAGAVFVIMLTALRLTGDGPTDEVNVWLTVFFSIVTLIGASAALFKRAWLRIDRDGFESSEFKSLGKIAWSDVSEFRMHLQAGRSLPASRQVAFELKKQRHKGLGRLSSVMFKGTIRLTEHYRVNGQRTGFGSGR